MFVDDECIDNNNAVAVDNGAGDSDDDDFDGS